MSDTQPAIVLDKVNKWYGPMHVLRDVTTTVGQNEKVVVWTPRDSCQKALKSRRCFFIKKSRKQDKKMCSNFKITNFPSKFKLSSCLV